MQMVLPFLDFLVLNLVEEFFFHRTRVLETMVNLKRTWFGAVHKLCRLKGGEVKFCQFHLVKRQLRGREGSKIIDF